MAKVGVGAEFHVEHRHEGGTYNPIENPLECHGYGHSGTTDGVGEYLSYEHPADGTPTEHEAGTVDHDAQHRYHAHRLIAKGECHTEGSYSHTDRPPY